MNKTNSGDVLSLMRWLLGVPAQEYGTRIISRRNALAAAVRLTEDACKARGPNPVTPDLVRTEFPAARSHTVGRTQLAILEDAVLAADHLVHGRAPETPALADYLARQIGGVAADVHAGREASAPSAERVRELLAAHLAGEIPADWMDKVVTALAPLVTAMVTPAYAEHADIARPPSGVAWQVEATDPHTGDGLTRTVYRADYTVICGDPCKVERVDSQDGGRTHVVIITGRSPDQARQEGGR